VQWNLNQFPHEGVAPMVPTQHVRLLFAGRNGHAATFVSRRVSRLGNRDCVDALLRTRAASLRLAAEAATFAPAVSPADHGRTALAPGLEDVPPNEAPPTRPGVALGRHDTAAPDPIAAHADPGADGFRLVAAAPGHDGA